MRVSSVSLLAAVASAASSPSICDKYTTALLKDNTAANQYTLLKLLVNTALIGNFTGPGTAQSSLPGSMVAVAGILAADGPLIHYFDGSMMDINLGQVGMGSGAGKLNFLDGGGAAPILKDPTSAGTTGSAQYELITHLWSYFGALLGCSGYGTADFPAYEGQPSMYAVHQYMDIGETEMTYFIEQVGGAALSFGASMADVDTVGMALNSTFGMRCAPAAAVVATQTELNAICIASSCPEATAPVCASYMAAASPSMAASSAAMSMPASGSASPTMPVASQISDGQPQATTPVTYTGAAAAPTMAAQIALAAGAIAAAIL